MKRGTLNDIDEVKKVANLARKSTGVSARLTESLLAKDNEEA